MYPIEINYTTMKCTSYSWIDRTIHLYVFYIVYKYKGISEDLFIIKFIYLKKS